MMIAMIWGVESKTNGPLGQSAEKNLLISSHLIQPCFDYARNIYYLILIDMLFNYIIINFII